jgi:hypothetical protein
MTFRGRRPVAARPIALACIGACLCGATSVQADDLLDLSAPGRWALVVAPFTQHLHDKPEFRYVWGIGVERQRDDRWLYGLSYFSNSFGQDSGYLYVGQQIPDLFDSPLYFQWSAGLLYGYKGEYANRVPFNQHGFSPGAVISLGWRFDEAFSVQLNKVGTSGIMLQLGYSWP